MKRGHRAYISTPKDNFESRIAYTVLRTYTNSKGVENVFLALGDLSIQECANYPDWDHIWSGDSDEIISTVGYA